MGKIFGLSDLPVSTIMTPFEPIRFVDVQRTVSNGSFAQETDVFVSKTKNVTKKPVLKIKNMARKLMPSFSKVEGQ